MWLGTKKEPLKSSPQEIASILEHSRIAGVRRVGKHIVFELETKPGRTGQSRASQWIVHLGMTGRLLVRDRQESLPPHTHAVVRLESSREILFVDPRRFGRLSVSADGTFTAPGAEPLDIQLDPFIAFFRGRRTPIKSALLNQSLLSGVITFMPMNLFFDLISARAGERMVLPARSWPGSSLPFARCSRKPSLLEVLPSPTMLGPMARRDSSSSVIASTAAKVGLVFCVRRPSNAS